jgi:inner membrane transporter RhtA
MAAVAGLVLLGQRLAAHEWVGIAMIITVNAAAVVLNSRTMRRPAALGVAPARVTAV